MNAMSAGSEETPLTLLSCWASQGRTSQRADSAAEVWVTLPVGWAGLVVQISTSCFIHDTGQLILTSV
ncbi:hypothetical protein J6590_071317 [Homalodisca vitripennis]|nr:hypothetical protein J6590_071317 [Homalodisca vitripennis]